MLWGESDGEITDRLYQELGDGVEGWKEAARVQKSIRTRAVLRKESEAEVSVTVRARGTRR
jgi:hypothetical protein